MWKKYLVYEWLVCVWSLVAFFFYFCVVVNMCVYECIVINWCVCVCVCACECLGVCVCVCVNTHVTH